MQKPGTLPGYSLPTVPATGDGADNGARVLQATCCPGRHCWDRAGWARSSLVLEALWGGSDLAILKISYIQCLLSYPHGPQIMKQNSMAPSFQSVTSQLCIIVTKTDFFALTIIVMINDNYNYCN